MESRIRELLILGLILTAMPGCLRVGGSAGYWKQSSAEPEANVHAVSFDSARLVPIKSKS